MCWVVWSAKLLLAVQRTSVVGTLVQVFIIRYSSLLIAIVPQFPRMTCHEQVNAVDVSDVIFQQRYDLNCRCLILCCHLQSCFASCNAHDTVPSEEPCTTSNVSGCPDPAKLLASGFVCSSKL